MDHIQHKNVVAVVHATQAVVLKYWRGPFRSVAGWDRVAIYSQLCVVTTRQRRWSCGLARSRPCFPDWPALSCGAGGSFGTALCNIPAGNHCSAQAAVEQHANYRHISLVGVAEQRQVGKLSSKALFFKLVQSRRNAPAEERPNSRGDGCQSRNHWAPCNPPRHGLSDREHNTFWDKSIQRLDQLINRLSEYLEHQIPRTLHIPMWWHAASALVNVFTSPAPGYVRTSVGDLLTGGGRHENDLQSKMVMEG